jgi:uncharacterized protein
MLAGMDIAGEKYVSVTTFRRNGTPVPTPVWIVRVADGRVGFTTDHDAGKVKRIRNNDAVTLRPCNMKGVVAADAPEVSGRAVVVDGAAYDEVWKAVKSKYKLIATMMGGWSKLTGLIKRKKSPGTAILITLD